jgi:hypothetical protein
MERVQVRVRQPAAAPQTYAAPAYEPEPPRSLNPQVEADLNDIQSRVNEIRQKMGHEPAVEDVRVR